jgi:large subunit ribosomal protein L17
MRHLKAGRKLSRNSAERRALYRNMVVALFRHGKIKTTEPKAKELRRVAERLITISKRSTSKAREKGPAVAIAARRRARLWVNDREVLQKLFNDFPERYAERAGGYTRIVKLHPRPGDNAPMALIELMPDEPKTAAPPPPPPEEEKPAKGKKKAKKAAEEPVAEAAAKPKRTRKKKTEEE